MPPLIHDLIASHVFGVLARVVLTGFFWSAGIFGLLKRDVMVQTIKAHALPAPGLIVALMVVTELAGSALVITDFQSLGWLGAGTLGIFTLLSIPLGHPFWRYQTPKEDGGDADRAGTSRGDRRPDVRDHPDGSLGLATTTQRPSQLLNVRSVSAFYGSGWSFAEPDLADAV